MSKNRTVTFWGASGMLLFALGTMLAAFIITYYFYYRFEQDVCDRYNDKQSAQARGIASELSHIINLIQKDLESLAVDEWSTTDPTAKVTQLHNFRLRFRDYVKNVGIIDANGGIIAPYQIEKLALAPEITKLTALNRATLSQLYLDTTTQEHLLSLVVPIKTRTAAGQFLVCNLNLTRWIKAYLTKEIPFSASNTWIVSQGGQIIAHNNPQLVGKSLDKLITTPNVSITTVNDFLHTALAGKGGQQRLELFGEGEQLIAYVPISLPGQQWLILSHIAYEELLNSAIIGVQPLVLAAGTFFAIFGVIVVFSVRNEQYKLLIERKLRRSLEQSEKKYRTLVENSNDAILLLTPDGYIKLVNKRLGQMLGYSDETLLGQDFREYVDPQHHHLVEKEWAKHEAGESSSYELRVLNAQKEILTLICSEAPVFGRDNEYIGNLAVLTDITDKKRSEWEIRRRNAELTSINSIIEAANHSLVETEILTALIDSVLTSLQLKACVIAKLDDTGQLRLAGSKGLTSPLQKFFFSAEGMAYLANKVTQNETELIALNPQNYAANFFWEYLWQEGFRTSCLLPIRFKDVCYGLIWVGDHQERFIHPDYFRLAYTVSQTMGSAIEKARIYQNACKRATRLETIYRVSEQMTALLGLEELLFTVSEQIYKTYGYYNINIFLYDEIKKDLVFTAGCGGFEAPPPANKRLNPGDGIVGQSFQRREPIVVPDVSENEHFIPVASLPNTRSELAVPLLSRDKIVGVLDVQSVDLNAFDEEDLLALQALAELIGVGVENAQLYEKLRSSLEETRRSQTFFARIAMESPIPTMVLTPEGNSVLFNKSAHSLLSNEIPNAESYNLLQDLPFAKTPVAEGFRQALNGHFTQFNFELPLKVPRTGGLRLEYLILRVTFFPLMDDNKQVSNIVGKFEDLTEKRQLEVALQQAQKMESIGTLAGGIAHDFNNILGGVLGYISFIRMKMNTNDPLYRYINIIESSSRRAADLTQQLLAFARGGKYRVQSLDLNAVVKEAIELIASTIPQNISIESNFCVERVVIEGDSSQIVQTVVNICINARDAMPNGGILNVSTRLVEVGEQVKYKHPDAHAGNYVMLRIADTGIGMSEETKRRIFEPFFTTKRDKKGTGLGLAMVYGIIKNHNGYLEVNSEVGKGTIFSIYLPLSEKALPTKSEKTITAILPGNESILVIEDNDMMRELVTEVLEDNGYQVFTVKTMAEALRHYREHNADIALVLLGIGLPSTQESRVMIHQLRQVSGAVKVLASASEDVDAQQVEGLKNEISGFIQKPYSVKNLLDKVRKVIDS
jgi:PAS domain S-box-containing protein